MPTLDYIWCIQTIFTGYWGLFTVPGNDPFILDFDPWKPLRATSENFGNMKKLNIHLHIKDKWHIHETMQVTTQVATLCDVSYEHNAQ